MKRVKLDTLKRGTSTTVISTSNAINTRKPVVLSSYAVAYAAVFTGEDEKKECVCSIMLVLMSLTSS